MDVKIDINMNVASKFAEVEGRVRALVYLQEGEKKNEFRIFLDSGKMFQVNADYDFDGLADQIFQGIGLMFPPAEKSAK